MQRLAVLGQPIAHSLSPAILDAALADLGLADEWSYEAIELAPAEFASRTRALAAEGFVGANVTIPHKKAALELADVASERAREIGAANTLSFTAGSIQAENTDAPGFLSALGPLPVGSKSLVLGAGGSARAVAWALLSAGAAVWVWNRTRANAQALVDDVGASVLDPPGRISLADFELLVNTTSVGLGGPKATDLDDLNLSAEELSDAHTVVDLVYGDATTALLAAAGAAGSRCIDGREVLVRQAAESFRIWTGVEPSLEVMRGAAHA